MRMLNREPDLWDWVFTTIFTCTKCSCRWQVDAGDLRCSGTLSHLVGSWLPFVDPETGDPLGVHVRCPVCRRDVVVEAPVDTHRPLTDLHIRRRQCIQRTELKRAKRAEESAMQIDNRIRPLQERIERLEEEIEGMREASRRRWF